MVKKLFTNKITALFIITILLYTPFTNKAYYMDSPVTVYGAKQMTKNLFNPPLGEYGKLLSKWNNTGITEDSFFHSTPHPPLISMYLAPIINWFGEKEIIINWCMFPFYFFSVFCFFLLISLFFKEDAFWLAIIFAISPAVFVNSQNVMVDTPLMSMVLASFYFLFRSENRMDTLWAGIFAGFACLIKFSAGTLFFTAFTYFFIKKDFKRSLLFFAPFVLFNGFWLIHNFLLFGKSQLISNEHSHYILGDLRYRLERMISYVGGAWIFPLFPISLFLLLKNRVKVVFISIVTLLPFFMFLILKKSYSIIESGFYIISVLSAILLIFAFSFFENNSIKKEFKYTLVVHLILQVLGGLFLTLYAVRYTLPFAFIMIIAFQLIVLEQNKISKHLIYKATISFSLLISIGLSISDYQISDANRSFAEEIKRINVDQKSVYYQGRLGYLYYMNHANFIYFEQNKHQFQDGDLILKNTYFSGDGELLEVVKNNIEKIEVFTFPLFNLITKGGVSGFYGYDRLPYWIVHPKKSNRKYILYRYTDNSTIDSVIVSKD